MSDGTTTYTVDFSNQTDRTWTLVVLMSLPSGATLDVVAWQLAPAPSSGHGSTSWTDGWNVVIGTPSDSTGSTVYTATQALAAAQDSAWKIVTSGGVAQLEDDGTALTPGTISIGNDSGATAYPGLGQGDPATDNGAVYYPGAPSGTTTAFTLEPTYVVLAVDQVRLGEVIATNQTLGASVVSVTSYVGPETLSFPAGATTASVTLAETNGSLGLTLAYGS